MLTNSTESDIIRYIFMQMRKWAKSSRVFAIILIKSKSKL